MTHRRCPEGWIAPGPKPTGPHDHIDLQPRAGEDLSYLTGDWRIFQLIDGHRWSLDDLITAWVAQRACVNPPGRILDLGCGIGSVLLMMAWSFPEARLVGVEAQAVSVALARRSLRWNGADHRAEVRLADLRAAEAYAADERFSLITGTPPYFARGSALESQKPQWAECHAEHRGGVETYSEAAARQLATGGQFVMCAAARDRERVTQSADAVGLRVRRRTDVIPRQGKAALFSVFVMDAHGNDSASIEDTLIVRDAAGLRTPAYLAVRRDMGMPP